MNTLLLFLWIHLLSMASLHRFNSCQSTEAVHNEFRTLLCCDFLNEETCKQQFTKFRLRCRNYLTTPTERSLDNPTDILDRLEQKGLFGLDKYSVIKDLVRDDSSGVLNLIEEAEQRISCIRGIYDVPGEKRNIRSKRQYNDRKYKDENVEKLRKRLIHINRHETEVIPVLPLQENFKLPVEKLYASVVIREDLSYNSRERGHAECTLSDNYNEVESPNDIFRKDDEYIERVFMLGDAARGKTTYCLWLLKQWCDLEKRDTEPSNEWEKTLKEFDVVFFVPMRKMSPSCESVTEMICENVLQGEPNLHDTVKHVFADDSYRCLVLFDGLDEWNQDKDVLRQTTQKVLPQTYNISNCTLLFTMRPWRFDIVAELVRNYDSVVEIKGLSMEGINDLISNLLVNHFGLDSVSNHFKEKNKANNANFKSFMQIPLLATFCVQIWYKQEDIGKSIISLYTAMINMLIKRAQKKHNKMGVLSNVPNTDDLPSIFAEYHQMKQFSHLLLILGKVAFENLVSMRRNMIFETDILREDIGEESLRMALHIGLISHREDISSVATRNVRVEFFHTSIQEYLAALYIFYYEEARDVFRNTLSSVLTVKKLSDVIMFVCGVCPSLGVSILEDVERIINNDSDICGNRRKDGLVRTVKEMYKNYARWYRELAVQQEKIDMPLTYNIPDIFIDDKSDIDTVMLTRNVLSDQSSNIKSLYFNKAHTDGEFSISNEMLDTFLSNENCTRSLNKLYVNGFHTNRCLSTICGPSLDTLSIYCVNEGNMNPSLPFLSSEMPQLRMLKLYSVDLGTRTLGLSSSMVNIEEIVLSRVYMSAEAWDLLVKALQTTTQNFSVELINTNIDNNTKKIILSYFDVRRRNCGNILHFRRGTFSNSAHDLSDQHEQSSNNVGRRDRETSSGLSTRHVEKNDMSKSSSEDTRNNSCCIYL